MKFRLIKRRTEDFKQTKKFNENISSDRCCSSRYTIDIHRLKNYREKFVKLTK